jgi:hypothetical protein
MRMATPSKTPRASARRHQISLNFCVVMSLILRTNSQRNFVEASTSTLLLDRHHIRRRQESRRNHPQLKHHGVNNDHHQRIHQRQQSDKIGDQGSKRGAEELQGKWHDRVPLILGTRLWDYVEEGAIDSADSAEAAPEKLQPPRIVSPAEASSLEEVNQWILGSNQCGLYMVLTPSLHRLLSIAVFVTLCLDNARCIVYRSCHDNSNAKRQLPACDRSGIGRNAAWDNNGLIISTISRIP